MTAATFPDPPFHLQHDPEADEGHIALLEACIRHHRNRPHVWQIACRAAAVKVAAGRRHGTIQAVIESARELAEDTRTSEQREQEFKIANADAAFFSRAMADLGIVPAGYFDFNEQPSKKRKAPQKAQTPAGVKPDRRRSRKRR